MKSPASHQIVIITGISGSGKSTALKTLEDLGFEAIDNIPLFMIGSLLDTYKQLKRPIAVGVDIRSHAFSANLFLEVISKLRQEKSIKLTLLFLDADDTILLRRYTETRRRHPLAKDRPVIDGILQERELLQPLQKIADIVLDTSEYNGHAFRQVIRQQFASNDNTALSLFVTSFSYRLGIPREADLVFDVRFLRNPHYDETLRSQNGQSPEVAAYVMEDPHYASFMNALGALLLPLLPDYLKEGKSYLTIAIGCTGGQHRSVCVCEEISKLLKSKNYDVTVRHRDMQGG